MHGANEPGLIDQDVAVRDDSSTATASVSDSTGGKLLVLYYNPELFNRDNVRLPTD